MSTQLAIRNDELGFIGFTSSDEIRGANEALDKSILRLAQAIKASKSPRVNKDFRDAFDSFRARWANFSGGQTYEGGRWSAYSWGYRYDDFLAAYERWFTQYQLRKLGTDPDATPSTVQPMSLLDEWLGRRGGDGGSSGTAWVIAGAVVVTAVLLTAVRR